MKRRRRILLILLACGVVAIVVALVWPEVGPQYQMLGLSEWVAVYRKAGDVHPYSPPGFPHAVMVRNPAPRLSAWGPWGTRWKKRYGGQALSPAAEKASTAIRAIGTNALPYLLSWIQHETPGWRNSLEMTLSRFDDPDGAYSFSDMLGPDPGEQRAQVAMVALQILGPEASSAIPELARLARNTNAPMVSRRALICLAYMGKEAIPVLLGIFTDPQVPILTRAEAAEEIKVMGYLGTSASPAVPVLLRCLSETNMAIATAAASALGGLGIEPEACVAGLTNCLQSPDKNLREVAARSLVLFGEAARPAIPAMIEVMNSGSNRDPFSRAMIATWLRRLDGEVLGTTNTVKER